MSVYDSLIKLEIATIGTLESVAHHERDPGYTVLFREAKTGKQANVEQMNTLLRMTGQTEVEAAGLSEPVLRLQSLALQRASTTALVQTMALVEEMFVARYRALVPTLHGLEQRAMQHVLRRTTKHWMILVAHTAVRKDADSRHAHVLPLPLSAYFAAGEDRVCMRCLLDRPGEKGSLEKSDPHTYVCAACHDEVMAAIPADLQVQVPRWSAAARRDRAIQRALGRPEKMRAIKEVHSVLAGLEPEVPLTGPQKRDESPPASRARRVPSPVVPSDIEIARDGASESELAYSDLLFDFRSVRGSW